ncbi:hypothetical protein HQ535_08550 [bacterium]|nr:hypothetical protein [bacterium]
MLVRIRWFLLGVAATIGGGAVAVGRLVRLRQQLTAANMARVAGHTAADVIEWAAHRIDGSEKGR